LSASAELLLPARRVA